MLIAYIKSALKPKYKLGIISNAAGDWVSELLSEDKAGLFDDITISYKIGFTKPDPKIYHASLKNLDVEPSDAVFIDDIDSYCVAARKVGMQAIHYQGFAQLERDLGRLLSVPDK